VRLPSRDSLPGHPSLPLWPPVLATLGPGSRSGWHAHHGMHFILSLNAKIRVRARGLPWALAHGVLTAPDVPHEVDSREADVVLVFLDPESAAGVALLAASAAPVRRLSRRENAALVAGADPGAIMRAGGVGWTSRAIDVLKGAPGALPRRRVHPRVSAALRVLRDAQPGLTTSLTALSGAVGLSPSRFMHAFTESIGVPLRPYIAWLKLQRAAGAIVSGIPLSQAAAVAGFADAAHMSRTFRRMFGMPPSSLVPKS
jgi:AraC-like DNA-binding protein